MKKFLGYIAIILISACSSAKKASEISPVYIPSTAYSNMTCSQLAQEAEVFRQRIPEAESAVEKHYSDQKTTKVVA
jgi:predicted phosphoribosyltransferase